MSDRQNGSSPTSSRIDQAVALVMKRKRAQGFEPDAGWPAYEAGVRRGLVTDMGQVAWLIEREGRDQWVSEKGTRAFSRSRTEERVRARLNLLAIDELLQGRHADLPIPSWVVDKAIWAGPTTQDAHDRLLRERRKLFDRHPGLAEDPVDPVAFSEELAAHADAARWFRNARPEEQRQVRRQQKEGHLSLLEARQA